MGKVLPKLILLGFALVLLSSCVSTEEQIAAVRNRAAYDFSCDGSKIEVIYLQSGTYGAQGCKAKQVYTAQGTMVYKEGAAPNPIYIEEPVVGGGAGLGIGYYGYRH